MTTPNLWCYEHLEQRIIILFCAIIGIYFIILLKRKNNFVLIISVFSIVQFLSPVLHDGPGDRAASELLYLSKKLRRQQQSTRIRHGVSPMWRKQRNIEGLVRPESNPWSSNLSVAFIMFILPNILTRKTL